MRGGREFFRQKLCVLGRGELFSVARNDCREKEEFKVKMMENQEFIVRSWT